MTLTYCWLGAAGLELVAQDYVLLVDPFFTRPGRAALILGTRVLSDTALAARYAPRADALLITHPHYDHLMDAPGILRRTGAVAYGSPNTCNLLGWHVIPAAQRVCIRAGDRVVIGPFTIEVFPGYHRPLPLGWGKNDALPVDAAYPLPLRLIDYRMDACYSFRITLEGCRLLIGSPCEIPGVAEPVSAAFIAPYQPSAEMAQVLRAFPPDLLVPIHWDDFNRPLRRPLRPMLVTPLPGEPAFPPLRRLDLAGFVAQAQTVLPGLKVRLPELWQRVALG